MLTRLKHWLGRESPLERHIRLLERENSRLVARETQLLDRLLAREGYAPIAPPAQAQPAAPSGIPFLDDDVIREQDEKAEIEERAMMAATDPDYMDQVVYNVESGDRRWQPILDKARDMMEKAH